MKYQGKIQDISTHKTDRPPSVGEDATRPDPEVSEKKPRRHFTASYKLRTLKEFDACTQPGEKELIPYVLKEVEKLQKQFRVPWW